MIKLVENKFLVSLLISSIIFNTITAQNLVVNGVVSSSEDKTPIPAASVVLKVMTNGTASDFMKIIFSEISKNLTLYKCYEQN